MIENNPKKIQSNIDDHFKELLGRSNEHTIGLQQDIWEENHNLDEMDNQIEEEEIKEVINK